MPSSNFSLFLSISHSLIWSVTVGGMIGFCISGRERERERERERREREREGGGGEGEWLGEVYTFTSISLTLANI